MRTLSNSTDHYDGLKVLVFDSSLESSRILFIQCIVDGAVTFCEEIASAPLPLTPESCANLANLTYLYKALCRYVNSGGKLRQVSMLRLTNLVEQSDYKPMSDNELLLAVSQEDSERINVFVNAETGDCRVVSENVYTENMDIIELVECITNGDIGIEFWEPIDVSAVQCDTGIGVKEEDS